jgi:hypothetical protein
MYVCSVHNRHLCTVYVFVTRYRIHFLIIALGCTFFKTILRQSYLSYALLLL